MLVKRQNLPRVPLPQSKPSSVENIKEATKN